MSASDSGADRSAGIERMIILAYYGRSCCKAARAAETRTPIGNADIGKAESLLKRPQPRLKANFESGTPIRRSPLVPDQLRNFRCRVGVPFSAHGIGPTRLNKDASTADRIAPPYSLSSPRTTAMTVAVALRAVASAGFTRKIASSGAARATAIHQRGGGPFGPDR